LQGRKSKNSPKKKKIIGKHNKLILPRKNGEGHKGSRGRSNFGNLASWKRPENKSNRKRGKTLICTFAQGKNGWPKKVPPNKILENAQGKKTGSATAGEKMRGGGLTHAKGLFQGERKIQQVTDGNEGL